MSKDLRLIEWECKSKADAARVIRQSLIHDRTRKSCAVCGKYEYITHAHHIPSIAELAQLCFEYKIWHGLMTAKVVWLCPNHHALFHLMQSGKQALEVAAAKETPEAEWNALKEINDLYVEELTLRFKTVSECLDARREAGE